MVNQVPCPVCDGLNEMASMVCTSCGTRFTKKTSQAVGGGGGTVATAGFAEVDDFVPFARPTPPKVAPIGSASPPPRTPAPSLAAPPIPAPPIPAPVIPPSAAPPVPAPLAPQVAMPGPAPAAWKPLPPEPAATPSAPTVRAAPDEFESFARPTPAKSQPLPSGSFATPVPVAPPPTPAAAPPPPTPVAPLSPPPTPPPTAPAPVPRQAQPPEVLESVPGATAASTGDGWGVREAAPTSSHLLQMPDQARPEDQPLAGLRALPGSERGATAKPQTPAWQDVHQAPPVHTRPPRRPMRVVLMLLLAVVVIAGAIGGWAVVTGRLHVSSVPPPGPRTTATTTAR